jgi:hypothetical protein
MMNGAAGQASGWRDSRRTRNPGDVVIEHDPISEAILIAACLAASDARKRVLSSVPADRFVEPKHHAIYLALVELDRRGLALDVDTLKQLGKDVDADYVLQLRSDRPEVPANLGFHIERVLWDGARLACATGPIAQLVQLLKDPLADADTVRETARAVHESFASTRTSSGEALTASELAAPVEKIDWLCRDFSIIAGRVTMLAGDPGVSKTILNLDLGLAIAAGMPTAFGGVPIRGPGAFTYVDYDGMGELAHRVRVQRLAYSRQIDLASLDDKFQVVTSPKMNLVAKGAREYMLRLCDGQRLVAIGTLRAATGTQKENDSDFAASIYLLNGVSSETGCSIVVEHHNIKTIDATSERPKHDKMRGTGAIRGASGSQLMIENEHGTISIEQCKEVLTGRRGVVRYLRLLDEGGPLAADPETTEGLAIVGLDEAAARRNAERREATAEEKKTHALKLPLLRALAGAGAQLSQTKATQLVAGNAAAKRRALDSLAREGLLARTERGQSILYEITPEGRRELDLRK